MCVRRVSYLFLSNITFDCFNYQNYLFSYFHSPSQLNFFLLQESTYSWQHPILLDYRKQHSHLAGLYEFNYVVPLLLLCTVLSCIVLSAMYFTVVQCSVLYCTLVYYTVFYCTVLYHTILYYTVLYYTILCCTVLYCTVLYYTVLYCTVLYGTVMYCTVLYGTVMYCTVIHSLIWCSIKQYYTALNQSNLVIISFLLSAFI